MPCSLTEAISITTEARVVTSLGGTILHTNRAWHDTTGYSFLDVVGKGCDILQGPATGGAELQKLSAALQAGEACSVELINYRKDGKPFRNHLRCEMVSDGLHWVATITDAAPITDGSVAALHRTEEELASHAPLSPVNYAEPDNYAHARKRVKRCEEKLRLGDVLGDNTDPIVLCSAEYPHVIMHPNQPWLEMCGYTLEEVEGLTNKILTGPETKPEALAHLNACVRRKEPSVQTLVNYKKGGKRFLNQVKTVPVYNEDDEVEAFASMLREVDESHIGSSALGSSCEHLWVALQARLDVSGAVLGADSADAPARAEAARALASNHAAVLADMTSAAPAVSQPTLERVPSALAGYAEQGLREVCRRLILGRGAEHGQEIRGLLPEQLDASHPSSRAQQSTWALVATYLDARIQTEPHPSGRAPDMSKAAATAMRRVLRDMRA